jgi:hypothetical protein
MTSVLELSTCWVMTSVPELSYCWVMTSVPELSTYDANLAMQVKMGVGKRVLGILDPQSSLTEKNY